MASRRALLKALRAYQSALESHSKDLHTALSSIPRRDASFSNSTRWFLSKESAPPNTRFVGLTKPSPLFSATIYDHTISPSILYSRRYLHNVTYPALQEVVSNQPSTTPPTTPIPLTKPTDQSPPSPKQQQASTYALAEFADAEECDEALEDLEQTRKRVRALRRPPPGYISPSQRAKQFAAAVARALSVTVQVLSSVPARVSRFASLPKEDRKAIYAGWWIAIKKEAKHYWLGTKLLWKDIKIASRLVSKILAGKTLSRRERQQLTRTTADMFRLVPMLVFVVIPFMEFLLPVALKLFPNMLPSTFEDKLKKEEDMKRRISAQLEIARFLQDTVAEMADDMTTMKSGETQTSAAELYEFMQKVRAGESVEPGELLKFAKLFNDELTLDNLERVQLVSLCRFVGIRPFGTDAFLRTRLRAHLTDIKGDDREIEEEGLENLTEDELRQACRARGMRAPFGEGSAPFMRKQLGEWLDWSLNRSLPSSLLLLSRAFTVTSPIGKPAAVDVSSIRETLSTMPDEAVEDVELFATSDGGDKTEAYERKLDLLEREEELIKEEEEAAILLDLPVTAGKTTAKEMAATAAAAAVVREAAASSLADFLDKESEEERAAKEAAAKEMKMRTVLHALAALASSSGVTTEREAFMDLVEKEIDRLNSQLKGRGVGMIFTKGHLEVDRDRLKEALGQKRLEEKVTGILRRVEKELDRVDSMIGDKLRVLDMDNDGVISVEELKSAMAFLRQELGEEELRTMLEKLNEEAGTNGGIDVGKLMDMALAHNTASGEKDDD